MASELEKSALQRIETLISALEAAQNAGFDAPEIGAELARLHAERAELEGFGQSETEDDKKRKQDAQALKVAAYEQEIDHYAEHGFDSKEELFGFAKKFKDPDFLEALDGKSEEEKKKLAENIAKAYADMSPEEQRKFRQEYPQCFKWANDQGYDLESRDNGKNSALQQEFAKAGNQEGVEAAERLIAANDRVKQLEASERGSSALSAEMKEARLERLIAKTNVIEHLPDVVNVEHQEKVKSNEDLFAALIEAESSKHQQVATVNTLAAKPTDLAVLQTGSSAERYSLEVYWLGPETNPAVLTGG